MGADLARLHLLASAIAGRSLEVADCDDALPWTDGATIFIPAGSDRLAVPAMVTVQASLIAGGSLDAAVLPALARHPGHISRYLAVEGHRALAGLEARLPASVLRIIDPPTARRSTDPAASLALAAGSQPLPDPPPVFGTIRPRQVRRRPDGDEGAPLDRSRGREQPLPELDEDEAPRGPDVSFLSSPVGGGGPLGRLLKRLLRDGGAQGGGGSPGVDRPTRASRKARRGASASVVIGPSRLLAGQDPAVAGGLRYPEWDVHRRSYRPDWCTVHEVAPGASDRPPVPVPETAALTRPLSHVALDLEAHHRQREGEDVDLDSMVAAYVELSAGRTPEHGVYISTLRTGRDLAVLLLLDISGSAGEPSSSGATVHDHQVHATAALAATLHHLGDRVCIQAFRSQGRSSVQVSTVLGFAGRFDAGTLHRLGQLQPGAYTRLGAAVRHATSTMDARAGSRRRLLVVVSDGFAYDHGYEAAYGEADARRALGEARRRGIGCVCLSIGAATDPVALRRVFGPAAQVSIAHPDTLASVVGPLFRSALRSADAGRRSHHRPRTRSAA